MIAQSCSSGKFAGVRMFYLIMCGNRTWCTMPLLSTVRLSFSGPPCTRPLPHSWNGWRRTAGPLGGLWPIRKNGQRAPNRAFAKALDHDLSISMGFGLDRFLPFASVSALREYERIYFAFVELLGAEPGAKTRRSCILDTRTKATRLELPVITRSGTPLVPKLFTRCDQCSIGWPRMLWLRCKVRLRGDCGLDRCHRYANDTKDACTLANLTLTRFEYALVCYVGVGPWEENAFFWKIKCAAAEMFVVMDASFHMYQLLYEGL